MQLSELDQKWFAEIEQAVEYVSLIDEQDDVLYVNRMSASPEQVQGRSVYDFVEAAYHSLLRNAVAEVRRTGVPQHYNSYAVNAQDTRSLYSNWVIPFGNSSTAGVVAFIATDVTKLNRIEEELELSESMLQSMVENSPDTIFVVDRERKLRFASKLEYGFDSSQVLGLKADLFIPADELPSAIELFENVLNNGAIESLEATVETPEGARTFNARLAPIRSRVQDDLVMIVVTDISERRKAELTQLHLREQLQQAQKMEAIGQLTGGVAHDFNNLLLTISGNLELAMSSFDTPDTQGTFIHEALNGVQRARDLTGRLLAFARRQPLRPEAVDIGDLLEKMDTLLRRTLGEDILIKLDSSEVGDHVSEVDRAQLENAILNLALNARDAMPEGGLLSVSARWVPDAEILGVVAPLGAIRIAVVDNGVGMDATTAAHAIDPFFTTKEVGEGSGLGLSMVYGFVQQSHGELRIRSELGEGTTVEIDLPCIVGDVEHKITPDRSSQVPAGNGELILLVEDDAGVRDVTANLLDGLGYRTLIAQDGDSAFQMLSENQDIQMLITDVVMPGPVSGFELANRCRAVRPDIPVMLVSGHPLDKRASQYRQQWLDALLQKPYRSDELARFVAKMLNPANTIETE